MSNFVTFAIGGVLFFLIGVHQSLLPILPPRLPSYHLPLFLSLLSTLSSLLSLLLQSNRDPLSFPLSLSFLLLSLLFLLHSLFKIFIRPLPSSVVELLLLAALALESMYLCQSKRVNPDGVENRYMDLLLVPVVVCAVGTCGAVLRPSDWEWKLGRGIGLMLHGTWLVQMGFSFFSSAIANGCAVRRRSWGDYTISCKSHQEAHRSSALATLQFNCHLGFVVILVLGVYSVISGRLLRGDDRSRYKALDVIESSELREEPPLQFTFESDEEGAGGIHH